VSDPFLQIIDLGDVSRKPFSYAGSDSATHSLEEDDIHWMMDAAMKIGAQLRKSGYRGLAGVDFLQDLETGRVFVQEVNTRIIWLGNLITAIQRDQSIALDFARHLQAFGISLQGRFDATRSNDEMDLSTKGYAQVTLLHTDDEPKTAARECRPGIFDITEGKLVPKNPSLCLKDMNEDQVLVTYFADLGTELAPDDLIANLMFKRSVVAQDCHGFSDWGRLVLDAVKRHVLEA